MPQQSEDCLNLDVYTPVPNASVSYPVIAWIYGGGLTNGYTGRYPNLQIFAEKHDVVVVSISYRMNAFGFLAHPALAIDDPRGVSGNYGLLDMQLGLSWIQENIKNFGGDPRRVTLFGQSSGGTAIYSLLASPASAGLFHGAISLSGSPNVTMGLEEAYLQNIPVVQNRSPCTSTNLTEVSECLYALSAGQVADMFPNSFSVGPALPVQTSGQFYPGLPIVDGVTVTLDVLSALANRTVDVPLILEVNLAEWDMFGTPEELANMTAAEYSDYLEHLLVSRGWMNGTGHVVYSLYEDEAVQDSVELAYQLWISDYSFLCGTIELGITAGQHYTSPVYVSLNVHAPGNPLYANPGIVLT